MEYFASGGPNKEFKSHLCSLMFDPHRVNYYRVLKICWNVQNQLEEEEVEKCKLHPSGN